jgi:hypothetical protein
MRAGQELLEEEMLTKIEKPQEKMDAKTHANQEFQRNTDVYNLNTRCKYDLHMPNDNLTECQAGVYYTVIKLFSKIFHLKSKA